MLSRAARTARLWSDDSSASNKKDVTVIRR
jgi:hypothetical protein